MSSSATILARAFAERAAFEKKWSEQLAQDLGVPVDGSKLGISCDASVELGAMPSTDIVEPGWYECTGRDYRVEVTGQSPVNGTVQFSNVYFGSENWRTDELSVKLFRKLFTPVPPASLKA